VDIYETLTTREREVRHQAAEGLSNPATGERLVKSKLFLTLLRR
jgi:hypothetical protein